MTELSPRRQLYFLAAGLLEGLRPRHVESASRLLDASEDQRHELIAARLRGMSHLGVHVDRSLAWPPQEKRDFHSLMPGSLSHGEVWRKTSGSSGIPFRFPRSPEMLRQMDAVMWAAYSWHGITPGDRHGVLWGRPMQGRARLRKKLSDFAMSRRRYDAFRVDESESVRYFHELRRYHPTWIYGYPSLTATFAEHCAAHGLSGRELGLRAIVLTGELLSEATREVVADFFGCRVVNEYGSTEGGVLGFECTSGVMHVTPGASLLESVGPSGLPVDREPGRFAITDLYPSSVAFDRLVLGDRGELEQSPSCACGRSLPAITALLGRNDSWIRLPSGRLVYDAVLAYSMPPGVAVFQGEQLAHDSLAVRLVVHPGATVDTYSIQTTLSERLHGEVSVAVQVVDALPVERSGKLRYFIPLAEAAGATSTDPEA